MGHTKQKGRGGRILECTTGFPITAAHGPTPTPEAEGEPWGGGRSTQKEVILQAQGLGAGQA